jgi:Protein of unknown function (DUF2946)
MLRRNRRPIVAIAVALVALEVLVTGLTAARAAAIAASDAFSAGAICHGASDAASAGRTAPDTDNRSDVCCAFCTAALPALVDLKAPVLAQLAPTQERGLIARARKAVLIAPRAVRAGPSQGPPSRAGV